MTGETTDSKNGGAGQRSGGMTSINQSFLGSQEMTSTTSSRHQSGNHDLCRSQRNPDLMRNYGRIQEGSPNESIERSMIM